MCRTSSSSLSIERNSFGEICFDLSLPSYPRLALIAVRRKLVIEIPGTTTGYWNARNMPMRARSSGSSSRMFFPLKRTSPLSTVYPGCPISVWDSVDLPDPFGPITAWTSPFEMSSDTPFRICRPSTLACKSLISKSANSVLVLLHDVCAVVGGFGHPRRAVDLDTQEPLVHLLLVETRKTCARRDVLDWAVAVADREPTVPELDHFGHVPVLAGQLGQLADPRLKV